MHEVAAVLDSLSSRPADCSTLLIGKLGRYDDVGKRRRKDKPIIIWPIGGKLFWWIDRLSPSLCLRMARDLYDSNQKMMGLE